jgi:hypothetical protein
MADERKKIGFFPVQELRKQLADAAKERYPDGPPDKRGGNTGLSEILREAAVLWLVRHRAGSADSLSRQETAVLAAHADLQLHSADSAEAWMELAGLACEDEEIRRHMDWLVGVLQKASRAKAGRSAPRGRGASTRGRSA